MNRMSERMAESQSSGATPTKRARAAGNNQEPAIDTLWHEDKKMHEDAMEMRRLEARVREQEIALRQAEADAKKEELRQRQNELAELRESREQQFALIQQMVALLASSIKKQ